LWRLLKRRIEINNFRFDRVFVCLHLFTIRRYTTMLTEKTTMTHNASLDRPPRLALPRLTLSKRALAKVLAEIKSSEFECFEARPTMTLKMPESNAPIGSLSRAQELLQIFKDAPTDTSGTFRQRRPTTSHDAS
jgi:hypothetical protein